MFNQRFSFKAFTSFALLVGGIVIATAGVVLYIAPPGRVANLTDWQVLGLSRGAWGEIRTTFALFFILAAALHVYFNWGVFMAYLSRRTSTMKPRKWELGAAVVFVTLLIALTLRGAPPFSTLMTLGERARASWTIPEDLADTGRMGTGTSGPTVATGAQPDTPTGTRTSGSGEGLGQLTLSALCERENIPLDEALARLEAEGISARGSDRLQSLATKLDRVPSEMASLVRGYGMGELTVEKLAEQEGLPLADALARLKAAGVSAQGNEQLRTLAEKSELVPAELANIVRGR